MTHMEMMMDELKDIKCQMIAAKPMMGGGNEMCVLADRGHELVCWRWAAKNGFYWGRYYEKKDLPKAMKDFEER